MSKTPRNPNGPKPTLTVASSNTPQDVALTKLVKQAASNPKVAKLPAATFSPEKLAELLNEITALRRETAELKAAAMAPTKPATDGKSEKSIKNEIAVVKAFAKAGFGKVTPHVDVMTFNRFMAQGVRPVEGSKSLKIGNLRLFHKSQCRVITSEERKANTEQSQAAVARNAKSKVVPINVIPQ